VTGIGDAIPAELRQAVAERLAELQAVDRLMREAARPSERLGRDDQDDDQSNKESHHEQQPAR
jgi:hypothetical protein